TAFFKALLPMAIASERKYGVPASVIMAQAALESGWAQEPIGNNIFGVKGKGPAGSKLVSTTEEVHGRTVAVKAQFAMYHSIAEAVDDHGQVYNNGYYTKGLKDYARTKDPYRFIRLVGGTYATDSKYAASVTSLMKAYKLTKLAASQGGH
ncbi:MAG: glucosaminidase domain-containing protein, partial [Candidatus Sericytochromatia bacterium]|nr:glucosaminidase domain-containing protein [Candidatus Sericytochromatia bacterium]